MASVPGTLVNMKCHEQLLYLAYGDMDPYKIVTGGRGKTNSHVNVWEPDTGALISSLNRELEGSTMDAMAVNGHQIVTANISNTEDSGIVRYRDFSNASCLKVNDEVDLPGKFRL